MNFLKYLFGGERDDSKSKEQIFDKKVIKDIITFSESAESTRLTGGRKMREGFANDLYNILGVKGVIPFNQILKEALKYTKEMYNAFEKNAGEINTFNKGVIAYEVSCALEVIYPAENKMEFFEKLFVNEFLYRFNLSHLVKKIEANFNTKAYDFDILTYGSDKFDSLKFNTSSLYLGYIIIPVDDECEFIITNNPKRNYDLSRFEDSIEAHANLIPVKAILSFIENEFRGSAKVAKVVNSNFLKRTDKTVPHMTIDDKYVYLVYMIS